MFRNKVVVITGGSRGIGADICSMFAANHAKVYFTYVSNKKNAEAVRDTIIKNGGDSCCIKTDVGNSEEVDQLFKEIHEKESQIDILINNAGIVKDSLTAMMKNENWDKVIQVNLSGAFYCSKIASRYMMRNENGTIINIASVAGLMGSFGQANYAAAKSGLITLTKTMARELGKFNIRVNTIAPGLIQTEMIAGLKSTYADEIIARTPLGRIGQPSEVTNAVKFLASNEASYINGACLTVDGGFSCC